MSYDMIDRFLRNNLDDDNYAEYSAALDELCTPPPQRTFVELTDEQQHAQFQAFVKAELGDIAVMDQGRYISPKIQNYWKIWIAAHNIKENT